MRRKVVKCIIKLLYAYLIILIIPFFIGIKEGTDYSNSVLSVGIYILIVWLSGRYWTRFWNTDIRNKFILCILSEAFLLALTLGKMLDEQGYLELKEWKTIASTLIMMPFGAMMLNQIYGILQKKMSFTEKDRIISKKENMIYALYLLICWGIVLLGVYPGFFVYDAVDEIMEVITRTFTTHHPLFHVLYMGGAVQAGYKIFGSYNLAIFFFILFQMFLFIVGVIYSVNKMSRFGFRRYICRGMIGVMGLFPVYPMIVLCSCKDSLFALIILLWVVTTYEWFQSPNRYSKIKWAACSVMLCLLRNNAIYALLVTGIIFILVKKGYRKAITTLLISVVMIATLLSGTMTVALNAKKAGHQEMLTVPIQQLTRTYQLSRESYTEEEVQKLYEFLPEKYLDRYSPKLSDGVKIGFQNEMYEDNPAEFWKLWLSIGTKAPMAYINAWLMTSYGYWYPDTVIDVYKGNQVHTFTYQDSSYFGFETEEPGYRESKISVINEFYRKLSLEIYKEKLPVVAQFFSPGFMFWLLLFIIGFMVLTRGLQSIMPYCFLVFVIATLLLGPTYLPRYVFFLWMTIPFMIGDMCNCRR